MIEENVKPWKARREGCVVCLSESCRCLSLYWMFLQIVKFVFLILLDLAGQFDGFDCCVTDSSIHKNISFSFTHHTIATFKLELSRILMPWHTNQDLILKARCKNHFLKPSLNKNSSHTGCQVVQGKNDNLSEGLFSNKWTVSLDTF